MTVLEGRPKFQIVKEPKGDKRLENFSAGDAFKWERDVTNLVRQKYEEGLVNFPRLRLLAMTSVAGMCSASVRGTRNNHSIPCRGNR